MSLGIEVGRLQSETVFLHTQEHSAEWQYKDCVLGGKTRAHCLVWGTVPEVSLRSSCSAPASCPGTMGFGREAGLLHSEVMLQDTKVH